MTLLADKVVLVTGGNQGIGRAICVACAREGAQVVVNYLHAPELASGLIEEMDGHGHLAIQADVRSEDAVNSMMQQADAVFGHVDVLVNNAGCESIHAALDLDLQEWDRIVDTNLRGAFICSKAAARMRVAHGSGA